LPKKSEKLNWTQKNIATMLIRLSKLLRTLRKHDKAKINAKKAYSTRNKMLCKHSEYLKENGRDEISDLGRSIHRKPKQTDLRESTDGLSRPILMLKQSHQI
jgi:hypothetical protein